MKDRIHSSLGPSNYPAWEQCARYESDGRDRADASAGSEIHEQAEKYITDGIEPDNATARWFGETTRSLAGDAEIETEVRLGNKIIWGYADAIWTDKNCIVHIADFKSFSDGTKDYSAQLEGYAYLHGMTHSEYSRDYILHILHGLERDVETHIVSYSHAKERTCKLLDPCENEEPRINSYCQFCKHIKECKAVNHAVQTVNENGVTFNELSLCQKLVVLDAVDKLSKSLREEAKRMAIENGGAIESDGIRYEMKPWAGKSVCKDLCALASDVASPSVNREEGAVDFVGLDSEELIKLCDLPRTKLISSLKEKNKGGKVKAKEIEQWVSDRYEKTEGSPHFVRTK